MPSLTRPFVASFVGVALCVFGAGAFAAEVAPAAPVQPTAVAAPAVVAPAVVAPAASVPAASVPEAKVVDKAEAKPAPAKPEAAQAEAKPEAAKTEAKAEEKKPKSWVILSERVSVGSLGKDLVAEYGVQAEVTSRHFGVSVFWANFQPYPDKVGFCQSFGFAFHYYPFAAGPGGEKGLYVGPGFHMLHFKKQPDPVKYNFLDYATRGDLGALSAGHYPVRSFSEWGLTTKYKTGYGKDYDLLGPVVRVGYRYKISYFSFGAELSTGWMFSDQPARKSSAWFFVFTPSIGFVW